jgi:hypothetical protein
VATGSRGSTLIRRSLLVQDHLQGGTRAADVETFARSLYTTQAVSLLDPPLHDFKSIALHWIQQHYGHLRQGLRLLTSSCDFLQMQHCPSRFWQLALPCLGMMEDIAPNGRVPPTTCDEREAVRSQPTPLITSRLSAAPSVLRRGGGVRSAISAPPPDCHLSGTAHGTTLL